MVHHAEVKTNDFWCVGTDVHGNSVDLRSCLYLGYAAMDPRNFKKVAFSNLETVATRRNLFLKILKALKTRPPSTAFSVGLVVKRFTKWSDEQSIDLSDATCEKALRLYVDTQHWTNEKQLRALLSVFAEILSELNLQDRLELISLSKREIKTAEDNWILKVEVRGGYSYIDFRRLLLPNDGVISVHKWHKLPDKRKFKGLKHGSSRTNVVVSIRDLFASKKESAEWRDASILDSSIKITAFIRWADKNKYKISSQTLVATLSKYSHFLDDKRRRKELKARSVYHSLYSIASVVAETLECFVHEVTAKVLMPNLKDGGYTSRAATNEDLKEYCGFLYTIINAITPELISSELIQPPKIHVGDKEIVLPAQADAFKGSVVPFVTRNNLLARLRIQSELNRFIAITGANLQVAQDLVVGDWVNRSSDSFSAFKQRAKHNIVLIIPKSYARELDRHIEFLKVFQNETTDDRVPLFPYYADRIPAVVIAQCRSGLFKTEAKSQSSHSGISLIDTLQRNKIKSLSSRQLRRAKADWLLRRYGGDSLQTSRVLGNSADVAFKSYGGKGNLVVAQIELSNFWEKYSELQFSRAPGFCSSPGNIDIAEEMKGFTTCGDGAACLRCQNYRGEDSIDYIHRMLTLQHSFKMRLRGNTQLEFNIEIINQIVNDFQLRNPQYANQVDDLKEQIKSGFNWHSRFSAVMSVQVNLNA